ncbi:MAG: energy transducer TonB [Bdellovibrio sp.]|nr:MAG: energy transducer TonB [Bdellovibrio sp.]
MNAMQNLNSLEIFTEILSSGTKWGHFGWNVFCRRDGERRKERDFMKRDTKWIVFSLLIHGGIVLGLVFAKFPQLRPFGQGWGGKPVEVEVVDIPHTKGAPPPKAIKVSALPAREVKKEISSSVNSKKRKKLAPAKVKKIKKMKKPIRKEPEPLAEDISIASQPHKLPEKKPSLVPEPKDTEDLLPEDSVQVAEEDLLEEPQPLLDESDEAVALASDEKEMKEENPLKKSEDEIQRKEENVVSSYETQKDSSPREGASISSRGIRDVTDLKQMAGNRPPQYPPLARLKKQEGDVKLVYFVTSDGKVRSVKVVQSSGYSLLDQEAVRAISRYRFFPGQQGYTFQEVKFRLKGKAKPLPSFLRRQKTSMYRYKK